MLLKAKSRNVNKFELFSNSPMWWMLSNMNPSGAKIGSQDNLQSWNNNDHITYLLNIAMHANEYWDIEFNYIEPFNEPMSNWWTSTNNQEGCHFSTSSQNDILNILHDEIASSKSNIQITASDENSYTLAMDTYSSINTTVKRYIDKVNVHGYEYGGGSRDGLYDAVNSDGKVLWNSEYGDGDSSGIELISNLNLDFKWLHMSAWVYWQPLDGGGWGLIQADLEQATLGDINTKYYVLAHYTRHILVNDVILDNDDSNTISSYSESNHRLTIITSNINKDSIDTCIDLSMFQVLSDDVEYWLTKIDSDTDGNTDKYKKYIDTIENMQNIENQLCLNIESNTIVTFEFQVSIV